MWTCYASCGTRRNNKRVACGSEQGASTMHRGYMWQTRSYKYPGAIPFLPATALLRFPIILNQHLRHFLKHYSVYMIPDKVRLLHIPPSHRHSSMPQCQTAQTVIRNTALADAERTQASTDIMYGVTPMHATNEASCAPGLRATHPARYRRLRPLTHLLSAHRRTPPSHYPNVRRVTRYVAPSLNAPHCSDAMSPHSNAMPPSGRSGMLRLMPRRLLHHPRNKPSTKSVAFQ